MNFVIFHILDLLFLPVDHRLQQIGLRRCRSSACGLRGRRLTILLQVVIVSLLNLQEQASEVFVLLNYLLEGLPKCLQRLFRLPSRIGQLGEALKAVCQILLKYDGILGNVPRNVSTGAILSVLVPHRRLEMDRRVGFDSCQCRGGLQIRHWGSSLTLPLALSDWSWFLATLEWRWTSVRVGRVKRVIERQIEVGPPLASSSIPWHQLVAGIVRSLSQFLIDIGDSLVSHFYEILDRSLQLSLVLVADGVSLLVVKRRLELEATLLLVQNFHRLLHRDDHSSSRALGQASLLHL